MKYIITFFTLLFVFVGCGSDSTKITKQKPNKTLSLSLDEEEHLFYLQKPFAKEKEKTLIDDKGNVVRLAVNNCQVLKTVEKEGIVVKWEVVLHPTLFYPFSRCVRNQISIDKNKTVEVFLGKIAFGAGGCCSVSGKFRTKNGIDWEEKVKREWVTFSNK